MPSIVKLLKDDHRKVKKLFTAFEEASDLQQKQNIVGTCVAEIELHASLEEEIFYPAMRRHREMTELIAEADEEHHVARTLMDELPAVDPSDVHWEAKFMVLMENVRHHIKEEEAEIFPKAEKLSDVEYLGTQFMEAKAHATGDPVSRQAPGKATAARTKAKRR